MTDEVSESMRLGVLMVVTAALLSSVLSILVLSLRLLNGFGTGVDTIAHNSQNSQIVSLSNQPYVSGPVTYTAVLNSIDSVDVVIIVKKGKAENITWNANNGTVTDPSILVTNSSVAFDGYVYRLGGGSAVARDKLSYLFTECSDKFFKIKVEDGKVKNAFKTIILEEVQR